MAIKINGKRYILVDHKRTKADAKKVASGMRRRGWLARVVRGKSGYWLIYAHNK